MDEEGYLGRDTQTIAYCEGWNRQYRELVEPISERTARRRHERGELYCAVLGDSDYPWAYVDVRLEVGYIRVHTLDELHRAAGTYLFLHEDGDPPGMLFLRVVYAHNWPDDPQAQDPISTRIHGYDPNGLATGNDPQGTETLTYNYWVHTEDAWLPEPAFGDFRWVDRVEYMIPSADLERPVPDDENGENAATGSADSAPPAT